MTDKTDEREEKRSEEAPKKDAFPGLRPGRRPSGKVQPHERALLFRLAPIGLALLVLWATPKPAWWGLGITLALTGVAFALGVFFVARTLMDR